MNRFLCDPHDLMLNNMTAFKFSQKLSNISIYVLPILALVGNSLTLLVVFNNIQLNHSSFSVYIKSMAISDTLVLLFKFISYQNKESKYYFSSMCTILIFCGEASVLLSIWTIVAITIERTLVVLFPLHIKKFVSVYRARVLTTIIAILTIIVSARLLIIPIDTSVKQTKRCHPQLNWHSYRQLNMTITQFGYIYIPLPIVIIGNLLTICTVKKAVIQRHDLLTHGNRSTQSNENQLMLMLLMVTLMFIVYFVPFTLTNIISRWGLPFNICFTTKAFEIYIILRALCEFLKDLNFCTNFIIYCISGRRFRHAFYSLHKCNTQQSINTSQYSETNKDRRRSIIYSGGLKLPTTNAIDESGILGTRRGLANIRWYEYTFLILGILATLVTVGLTIARLVTNHCSNSAEVAYGILILVHSIFLLLFLITGIFYQRITDIVAFFISAVMLTIYVITHYLTQKSRPSSSCNTQEEIRLTRLIFTIVFNICFIPLTFLVIKDYRRDEFSKRLFGAFPIARRPLQIYGVFDCILRLSTMLSISTLVLNTYNYTDHNALDTVLLSMGIPIALLWLGFGIGMARLENLILLFIFYFLSLFQLGFLSYSFYTTIKYSKDKPQIPVSTTTSTAANSVVDFVPILHVLYVCLTANLLAHIISMILAFCCTRNFNKGLKERVFNNKFDKWFQQRFQK
ncbi:unnamed protein product [Adineta steineri]|uniref:G-protein coupled receptors family 1 profile domain-containing protein n=1 Tax=Adineta steineri TaxID=433720 RepID=A0A818HDS5_9BILA|nr:unnamed protein product [Adineta steineri]